MKILIDMKSVFRFSLLCFMRLCAFLFSPNFVWDVFGDYWSSVKPEDCGFPLDDVPDSVVFFDK